ALGCGTSGGGPIPPLPGGYSNASLQGQYVIAQTGIGVNQAGACCDPFSETIIFTADGSENLNITVDDFDQVGGPFRDHTTGTYHINRDGTGTLIFNYSTQSIYAITMIDDNHFYVIEQDFFATASGFGEKQDTAAFSAAPSGTFVFKAVRVPAWGESPSPAAPSTAPKIFSLWDFCPRARRSPPPSP
ncbi:MAG: hypothetical protein LAO22_18320, partial [Acidobacteriia bacterium]|nr:hypothetical protein [Terriglobia bacterium]